MTKAVPFPSDRTPRNSRLQNYEGGVKSFYSGATVLMTGGTGFLGKALIESLLRKTEVKKIYLLIRSAKNKSAEERFGDLLESSVFHRLKNEAPERLSALSLLNGDLGLKDLGLTEESRSKVVDEVEIVFHGAATVSFTENLKLATEINVKGTYNVLELAKNIKNLEVIMHISTAYSSPDVGVCRERVYPIENGLHLMKLADSINYETAENITKVIVGDFLNTYILTKRSTENMIAREYENLPVGIFRPSVVCCAYREPSPGWIDTRLGVTGLVMPIICGQAHTSLQSPTGNADIVPVDSVANCLISAGRDTWLKYQKSNADHKRLMVYNFVPSVEAPTSWEAFIQSLVNSARKNSPKATVWYPYYHSTGSLAVYRIIILITHYFPACVLDLIGAVFGKTPQYLASYRKLNGHVLAISLFGLKDWHFKNENVVSLWKEMSSEDRELFPFSFEGFDWNSYFEINMKGIRKFLFREEIDEIEGKRRARRLYIFHIVSIFLLIMMAAGAIYTSLNF